MKYAVLLPGRVNGRRVAMLLAAAPNPIVTKGHRFVVVKPRRPQGTMRLSATAGGRAAYLDDVTQVQIEELARQRELFGNPAYTPAGYRLRAYAIARRVRERRPVKVERKRARVHERYADPATFDRRSFRVTELRPGVQATVGCLAGWRLRPGVG